MPFSPIAGASTPAAFQGVPQGIRAHYKHLHPGLELMRDQYGNPTPLKQRSGGLYSVRRLVLINVVNPTAEPRIEIVQNSAPPQSWPIRQHERISDPANHPEDAKAGPGNVEVLFDDVQELQAYVKAFDRPGVAIHDPLAKNDLASDQFPTNLKLEPPPG